MLLVILVQLDHSLLCRGRRTHDEKRMDGKAECFDTTPHSDEMRDSVSHIFITIILRVTMQAVLVQVTYLDYHPFNRCGVIHLSRTAYVRIQFSAVEATLRLRVVVYNSQCLRYFTATGPLNSLDGSLYPAPRKAYYWGYFAARGTKLPGLIATSCIKRS